MRAVAGRFDAAFRHGGMTGVALDIADCYGGATSPAVRVFALRDCLVFDATSNDLGERGGTRLNGGHLPFWQTGTVAARWHRYGPLAGFDGNARLVAYLRDGSTLVWDRLAALRSPAAGLYAAAIPRRDLAAAGRRAPGRGCGRRAGEADAAPAGATAHPGAVRKMGMLREWRQHPVWHWAESAALLLVAACAAPGGPGGTAGRFDVPWTAQGIAHRMDSGFNTAGLPRLRDEVERCYETATSGRSVMREVLRGCLVQDYTAWRVDSRVLGAQIGHSPYWAREAINERWARYGVLAGFGSADEILAYQRRGSDAVVAFLVWNELPLSWQAGFGPRPVQRLRSGAF